MYTCGYYVFFFFFFYFFLSLGEDKLAYEDTPQNTKLKMIHLFAIIKLYLK